MAEYRLGKCVRLGELLPAMSHVDYLHLPAGTVPPPPDGSGPYRAVVIVEQSLDNDWRNAVSDWLVQSGCLYMMAWGEDCSLWDDSVDWASLANSDFQDVPDEQFVMTTWHEQETLAEVFWYAQFCAFNPTVEMPRTLLLHIATEAREAEMRALFDWARDMPLEDDPS